MSTAKRTPSDPFLQHVPMPHTATLNVLGMPVVFESNVAWLMALAREAFGALPECASKPCQPVRVRLLYNADVPKAPSSQPPIANVYADGAVVGAVFSPSDVVLCSPPLGRALVTVSPIMRAFPHTVRYEMIEFACYRLVSHALDAVGLHAACMAQAGRAWLIFGESGAGKSTLTMACLLRGWQFVAEDSVFVLPGEPVAQVRGVPAFVHLMDDALAFFPGHIFKSRIIYRRSGKAKHEIDLRQSFAEQVQVDAALAGLIFLGPRRKSAGPSVRRVTDDAVRRYLIKTQAFAPNYPRWPNALDNMARLPAYAVASGTDVWLTGAALQTVVASGDAPGL